MTMSAGGSTLEVAGFVLRFRAVSSSQMPDSVGGETMRHKNSCAYALLYRRKAAQEIGLKLFQFFVLFWLFC